MSERKQALWRDLSAARDHLNLVLDTVGDRWETPVYSEGAAWNVRQLVVHLMVADQGNNNQVMGIAEGREVIPADFDLERYNRRSVEKRAEVTVEAARAALAESRAALGAWLELLDEAKLDREGRHGTMQMLTVAQILALMASHERGHADDIARALESA
jgi:uncharacterized damage-inducible protein DinB